MADDRRIDLFSRAKISKAVFSLSVPMVISSLVSLLYSLADTYFVGLINDPVQTAAVTLASSVLLAFNAVNNLFGVGSSSMMSRALGRGDMKTLRQSSAFGFYGALASGLLYSLACAALMQPLLRLLGADAITAPVTRQYLFWTVCLGAMPSILNVVMAYMIRSEGATLHASIGTMSGCVINLILDPIFILGLGRGAEGAAMATLISNCCAVGYFFGYLFFKRRSTYVCISPREFTLRREVSLGVCAVGVPAAIQNLLNVISHMLFNNLAAPFGAQALAGMGIASKIAMVPWYVANGISMGVQPLLGYTYASGQHARMKKALFFSIRAAEAIILLMVACSCLFARQLTGLFMKDAQTVAYSARFLYGMAPSAPFLMLDFMIVGTFQALGKGKLSLTMALLRKVVFEMPFLLVLNFLFPLYGIACSQLCAEICMSVVAVLLLKRLLRELPDERLTC